MKHLLCLAIAVFFSVSSTVLGSEGAFRLFDSFETFAGSSGITINGAAGKNGRIAWTSSADAVVVKGDGTAYHQSNYLRIQDSDANQRFATMTLSDTNRVALIPCGRDSSDANVLSRGTRFSFAFRRTAVEGAEDSLSGCNLTPAFVSTNALSGIISGNGATYNLCSTASELGVWYLCEGRLVTFQWNTTQIQCTLYLWITNTRTGETVVTKNNTCRANLNHTNPGDFVLSALRFQTFSSAQCYFDIDDIRIGPEYPPVTIIKIR